MKPRTVVMRLESLTPYSSSKATISERRKSESGREWEERIWHERIHVSPDGNAFIPPMAFKKSFAIAAKHLSIRIVGKGQATYSKFFDSAVFVPRGMIYATDVVDADGNWTAALGTTVKGEWLFVPAQPSKPKAGRVWKKYPYVEHWCGPLEVTVASEEIPADVFLDVVEYAGNCIGVGRFRPENGGYYGRFRVLDVAWDGV